MKDLEGHVIFVNRHLASRLGFTPSSMEAQKLDALVGGSIHEASNKEDAIVIRTGNSTFFKKTVNVQGHNQTFLTNKFPLRNETGEIVAVAAITTDITSEQEAIEFAERIKQKAEQSEQLLSAYRAALEQAAGVVMTDATGRIIYANELFCKMSGFEFSDLLGEGFGKLHSHQTPKTVFADLWKVISNGKMWRGELCNHSKSGQEYWVDATIIPIKNAQGEIERYISTQLEITDKKRKEEELKVAEAKALDASETKALFLANMSHEIRTPLNAIIGMTNLFMETQMSKEQEEYAKVIQVSGSALLGIVNDVLDFSKIEAGTIDLKAEKFSVQELVENCVKMIYPKIKETGNTVEVTVGSDIPSEVHGDMGRVGQVLINLLSNAAKFTTKGKIKVEAEKIHSEQKSQQKGGSGDETSVRIRFSVTDTGAGISEKNKEALFEPFTQRPDGKKKRFGGTGLGLSISKRLINAMGGEISVRSELGKGAHFWFDLSLEKPSEKKLAKPSADSSIAQAKLDGNKKGSNGIHSPGSYKILVVDDYEPNRKLLKLYLKDPRFDVDFAEGGKEALSKVQEKKFDLILMDIQMPDWDGYLTLQKLFEIENSLCPVVALTANVVEGEKENCLKHGFSFYLPKPVSKTDLLATVEKFKPKAKAA